MVEAPQAQPDSWQMHNVCRTPRDSITVICDMFIHQCELHHPLKNCDRPTMALATLAPPLHLEYVEADGAARVDGGVQEYGVALGPQEPRQPPLEQLPRPPRRASHRLPQVHALVPRVVRLRKPAPRCDLVSRLPTTD